MGAFLRHRVLAYDAGLKLPSLAMLSFGLWFCFWWVLVPGIPSIALGLVVATIVPISFSTAVFLTAGLTLFALLPIMSKLRSEFFPAYLACVTLMFGKTHRALLRREIANREHTAWETQHG